MRFQQHRNRARVLRPHIRIIVLLVALGMAASTSAAGSSGVVICSDYISSGSAGLLQLEAPWAFTPDLQPVYQDAVAVWHEGLVYVVNRKGADNIQVLDPARNLTNVRQFSLGMDRGLKHIAFVDDGTAYVSCYDTAELLHIDPVSGAILHVISTAPFADADGRPETSWLAVDGQRLFVACERLDRNDWYAPVGDSYLLALDMQSNTWIDCDPGQAGVQGILLSAANPYCEPVREGRRLLIGCSGFFGMQDGGVDVVDLDALTSLGLEITEAQLGGDVVDLTAGPDGRRHAVISNAAFETALKVYDTGGLLATLHQSTGFHIADIAFDGGLQIIVADRRPEQSGIRVYDAQSGAQLTTGVIPTGLPPAFICLPAQPAVPVMDLPAPLLALSDPYPNPANPRTHVTITSHPGSSVDVRVLDVRGRLVRRAILTADAAGRVAWRFDGLDSRGRAVASGVYRIVAVGSGALAARSMTVVR